MTRISRKCIACICIAVMSGIPVYVYGTGVDTTPTTTTTTTTTSTTKGELDKAQSQEQQKKKELEAVQATIDSLKGDITNTEQYINELDNQVNEIAEDIKDLNGKIDDKNVEIDVTTQRLEAAKITEKEQYEAMKLRIKYMYENNDATYFSMMVSAGSISDLLNQAEYVNKISEYDRNKLDEYIATKEQIASDKLQLEKEEEELQDFKVEMENHQEAVQLVLDAKNEEMEKLMQDKKKYTEKQKELEKDLQALDSLITQLTSKYNAEQLIKANAVATQSSLYGKSLLLWPCPSSHLISSGFSPNRLDPVTGSYYSAHKGTDIAAPTGSPVLAAASGLVTAAGYSASMGNYVVISHGDGITTRYYHNSSLAVSEGQAVTCGQVISYVGSTGWSTGPHLHFEVRINDVPYDAMQFFN